MTSVPQRRRGVTDDQPVRAFGGAPKALCIREKCCSSLATTSKARPSRPARHDKLAEIVIRAGRQALLVVADEGVRGQGDHRQPNSGIAAMLDSDSRRSNLGPRPLLRLPQAACMGAKPSPVDPKPAHARAQGVGIDAQELSRTEWPLDAS